MPTGKCSTKRSRMMVQNCMPAGMTWWMADKCYQCPMYMGESRGLTAAVHRQCSEEGSCTRTGAGALSCPSNAKVMAQGQKQNITVEAAPKCRKLRALLSKTVPATHSVHCVTWAQTTLDCGACSLLVFPRAIHQVTQYQGGDVHQHQADQDLIGIKTVTQQGQWPPRPCHPTPRRAK